MPFWKRKKKQKEQEKQIPYSGAYAEGLGTAIWTTRNYANFAKEAYIKNYISFRCIDIIAQDVSSVPWSVFKTVDDGREEQPNSPIQKLLKCPNPRQGFSAFQYRTISFLCLTGNAYVEKLAPETGPNKGLPKELYCQRSDQIKPLLDSMTNEHIGWVMEVNGVRVKEWLFDPITGECDLLHLKKFHPLSDIEGLSPVEPAARSIDTSNEALDWNKKLLQNDARPGMLLFYDGVLGDKQFEQLQKQLQQKYVGANGTGQNLIIHGNWKDAKPYSISPKDMDFLKGNWDLARQICLVWGVPPQVLGIPGDSTFANFEQARLYLWETTIFFYLMLLKDEYNSFFFKGNSDIFADYILDDIPALMPRRKEKWEMVTKSDFLTVNEKREEMGKEEIDGGDVLLVPASMIPLDTVGIGEGDVDGAEEEVEEEDEIGEEMQGIIFDWKFEPDEEKPFANEHACRLKDPGQFTSFARKNNAAKINGKKVDHIYGIKSGKSTLQSVRFPKSIWSASDAKKHCSGTFEAAKSDG